MEANINRQRLTDGRMKGGSKDQRARKIKSDKNEVKQK